MEILLLGTVTLIAIMVLGFIAVCWALFAPRYEHRSPFNNQPDVAVPSRFEKLWNKAQDDIETKNIREARVAVELRKLTGGNR